jgi:hypothetical protein
VTNTEVRGRVLDGADHQELLNIVRQAIVDELEKLYGVVNRDVKRDLTNAMFFKSKYPFSRLEG